LFRRLNDIIKSGQPPVELDKMFNRRRIAHKKLLSSHGDASRFFVTFLDNHDLDQRFYYQPPNSPHQFDDQLVLALTCLFCLQGIPCVYYGTEQGLHGAGTRREYVREALWGKPQAFDHQHPFYLAIQQLCTVRREYPALRYGRQYFRDLSGNGSDWGPSEFRHGVIAFSRILDDKELVVVANTSTQGSDITIHVQVDSGLNSVGTFVHLIYANPWSTVMPSSVMKLGERVGVQLVLKPMQVQVFTTS
jgi:glycosidase